MKSVCRLDLALTIFACGSIPSGPIQYHHSKNFISQIFVFIRALVKYMIALRRHGEEIQATQELRERLPLGKHRNIKKKKKSNSHWPRSRDRSWHKQSPFSENSSELSEPSSSWSESPFPSKSSYEMCGKPSRDLFQRALSQLNKHSE